jgi:hypothetical protein
MFVCFRMLPFKTVSKGLITTNEDRSLVYYFKRKKSIVVKKKIVFKLMQHRPQVHSNVSIKFIFGSNSHFRFLKQSMLTRVMLQIRFSRSKFDVIKLPEKVNTKGN